MAEENNGVVMYKYLDSAGLSKVWGKIKDNFSTKQELADVNTQIDEIKNSITDSLISSVDDLTIKAEANGKIGTSIGLDLDTAKQHINLVALGVNATDENRILSTIDYSKFVLKDSFLETVEIVVISDATEGREPGTYLKFSFNTESGKNEIYVNVSEFVNLYEGDSYIEVVDNKTITLKYTELVNDLKGTFATLEAMSELDARIQSNLSSINALIEQITGKASQAELDALTVRVGAAETDIDSLEQRIVGLENAMGPDGELVTISINQVTDFGPMTDEDINNACGGTSVNE
jgi:hypothetical protein